MATVYFARPELSHVARVVREAVQKIDYDLGDCNNDTTRATLLQQRVFLVSALGEMSLAEEE